MIASKVGHPQRWTNKSIIIYWVRAPEAQHSAVAQLSLEPNRQEKYWQSSSLIIRPKHGRGYGLDQD